MPLTDIPKCSSNLPPQPPLDYLSNERQAYFERACFLTSHGWTELTNKSVAQQTDNATTEEQTVSLALPPTLISSSTLPSALAAKLIAATDHHTTPSTSPSPTPTPTPSTTALPPPVAPTPPTLLRTDTTCCPSPTCRSCPLSLALSLCPTLVISLGIADFACGQVEPVTGLLSLARQRTRSAASPAVLAPPTAHPLVDLDWIASMYGTRIHAPPALGGVLFALGAAGHRGTLLLLRLFRPYKGSTTTDLPHYTDAPHGDSKTTFTAETKSVVAAAGGIRQPLGWGVLRLGDLLESPEAVRREDGAILVDLPVYPVVGEGLSDDFCLDTGLRQLDKGALDSPIGSVPLTLRLGKGLHPSYPMTRLIHPSLETFDLGAPVAGNDGDDEDEPPLEEQYRLSLTTGAPSVHVSYYNDMCVTIDSLGLRSVDACVLVEVCVVPVGSLKPLSDGVYREAESSFASHGCTSVAWRSKGKAAVWSETLRVRVPLDEPCEVRFTMYHVAPDQWSETMTPDHAAGSDRPRFSKVFGAAALGGGGGGVAAEGDVTPAARYGSSYRFLLLGTCTISASVQDGMHVLPVRSSHKWLDGKKPIFCLRTETASSVRTPEGSLESFWTTISDPTSLKSAMGALQAAPTLDVVQYFPPILTAIFRLVRATGQLDAKAGRAVGVNAVHSISLLLARLAASHGTAATRRLADMYARTWFSLPDVADELARHWTLWLAKQKRRDTAGPPAGGTGAGGTAVGSAVGGADGDHEGVGDDGGGAGEFSGTETFLLGVLVKSLALSSSVSAVTQDRLIAVLKQLLVSLPRVAEPAAVVAALADAMRVFATLPGLSLAAILGEVLVAPGALDQTPGGGGATGVGDADGRRRSVVGLSLIAWIEDSWLAGQPDLHPILAQFLQQLGDAEAAGRPSAAVAQLTRWPALGARALAVALHLAAPLRRPTDTAVALVVARHASSIADLPADQVARATEQLLLALAATRSSTALPPLAGLLDALEPVLASDQVQLAAPVALTLAVVAEQSGKPKVALRAVAALVSRAPGYLWDFASTHVLVDLLHGSAAPRHVASLAPAEVAIGVVLRARDERALAELVSSGGSVGRRLVDKMRRLVEQAKLHGARPFSVAASLADRWRTGDVEDRLVWASCLAADRDLYAQLMGHVLVAHAAATLLGEAEVATACRRVAPALRTHNDARPGGPAADSPLASSSLLLIHLVAALEVAVSVAPASAVALLPPTLALATRLCTDGSLPDSVPLVLALDRLHALGSRASAALRHGDADTRRGAMVLLTVVDDTKGRSDIFVKAASYIVRLPGADWAARHAALAAEVGTDAGLKIVNKVTGETVRFGDVGRGQHPVLELSPLSPYVASAETNERVLGKDVEAAATVYAVDLSPTSKDDAFLGVSRLWLVGAATEARRMLVQGEAAWPQLVPVVRVEGERPAAQLSAEDLAAVLTQVTEAAADERRKRVAAHAEVLDRLVASLAVRRCAEVRHQVARARAIVRNLLAQREEEEAADNVNAVIIVDSDSDDEADASSSDDALIIE
uniref:C2 DOCK-type domain-containing protein n=1 Tax=Sexangularia sp. CB-2014 TaxID=1486929 RepID=A0A7S1VHI6_9EUKA